MKLFKKNMDKRQLISNIILIISSIVFVYSLYMIAAYYLDSFENKALYNDLKYQAMIAQQHNQKVFYDNTFDTLLHKVVLNETNIDGNKPDKKKMLPNILPYYKQNSDTVGWISVVGIKDDYPVVKAKDNDYYLETAFDKTKNRGGSIFMDYRNKADGTDKHIIIYGHNMRDDSMFGLLEKYKDRKHYEKNRIIKFNTLYEEDEWEVFSAYVTGIEFNYIKTRFKTPGEYDSFIKAIKDKNMHADSSIDIEVAQDDQILTLSTCTGEYNDARFVVHAKKIIQDGKKDKEGSDIEKQKDDKKKSADNKSSDNDNA